MRHSGLFFFAVQSCLPHFWHRHCPSGPPVDHIFHLLSSFILMDAFRHAFTERRCLELAMHHVILVQEPFEDRQHLSMVLDRAIHVFFGVVLTPCKNIETAQGYGPGITPNAYTLSAC